MPAWTPHDRVAAALKASPAPRFLTQLFDLPPGEYVIHVDAPELADDDRAGTLIISPASDDERRAYLRFSKFGADAAAHAEGLNPVYAHYEVFNDSLWVSYTEDESTPEMRGQSFRLKDILNSDLVIEDMCDFLALDLVSTRAGKEPLPPLESHQP